jgi:hypothetical protein
LWGTMDEKPTPDARLKAHVDLWIHGDRLVWSRLQLVYFVQFAFFSVAGYMRENDRLVIASCMLAVFLHLYILIIVHFDAQFRDKHADILLDRYELDANKYGLERLEKPLMVGFFKPFLRVFLFFCWIPIDVAVAVVLLSN